MTQSEASIVVGRSEPIQAVDASFGRDGMKMLLTGCFIASGLSQYGTCAGSRANRKPKPATISTVRQKPLPRRLKHEQSQSHHHEVHDRGQYEYQVPASAR
jgi:hypothetical protein